MTYSNSICHVIKVVCNVSVSESRHENYSFFSVREMSVQFTEVIVWRIVCRPTHRINIFQTLLLSNCNKPILHFPMQVKQLPYYVLHMCLLIFYMYMCTSIDILQAIPFSYIFMWHTMSFQFFFLYDQVKKCHLFLHLFQDFIVLYFIVMHINHICNHYSLCTL